MANQLPKEMLEEVSKLFYRYSYRSPSMDDISKELSISKKTLYKYVENKEDLIIQHLNFVLKPLQFTEENQNNSIAKFESCFDYISSFYWKFSPEALNDLATYYPTANKKIEDIQKNYFLKLIKKILVEGIQAGTFSRATPVNLLSHQLPKWIQSTISDSSSNRLKTQEEITQMNQFFVRSLVKDTKSDGN